MKIVRKIGILVVLMGLIACGRNPQTDLATETAAAQKEDSNQAGAVDSKNVEVAAMDSELNAAQAAESEETKSADSTATESTAAANAASTKTGQPADIKPSKEEAAAHSKLANPIKRNDFKPEDFGEATSVDDQALVTQITEYMHRIYFNYYFSRSLDADQNVNQDTMIRFGLSYIMQYQNKDLKFDYEKYQLYIPTRLIGEVVEQYFDYKPEQYPDYPEDNIKRDKDLYIVPVEDGCWNQALGLTELVRNDKGILKAVFAVKDKQSEKQLKQVVAYLKLSQQKPVILHYIEKEIEQ